MRNYKYASKNEAVIYESVSNGKGKKAINKILLGTYVDIVKQEGDWCKVVTAGPNGWIHADDLADTMGLKVFFLDVGQGDGLLIEIGKYKILIDAGPNNCMYGYLTKWQYTYLLKKNEKVHIDYLIISHFDVDHYKGYIPILKDTRFTFGTIVHAGILKLSTTKNPFNSGLGNVIKHNTKSYLTTYFEELRNLQQDFNFNREIFTFVNALQQAEVQQIIRVERGDVLLDEWVEGTSLKLEVLAPITEEIENNKAFVFWKNEGITINGHSLVLKLSFGSKTILLGGDLNSYSQKYLMEKYAHNNPFDVDVAKSCHHGSSDFSVDFMELMSPYATIISSGDNEGHSHPRADAIGCAGKYSKSKKPLVYSTELARSTSMKSNKILFGMINLRCNGETIYMSQMKEVKKNSDLWDSYEVQ